MEHSSKFNQQWPGKSELRCFDDKFSMKWWNVHADWKFEVSDWPISRKFETFTKREKQEERKMMEELNKLNLPMLLLTVAPSPSLCCLAKTFFTTILGLLNGESWLDPDILLLLALKFLRKPVKWIQGTPRWSDLCGTARVQVRQLTLSFSLRGFGWFCSVFWGVWFGGYL